jgi:MFS family permease
MSDLSSTSAVSGSPGHADEHGHAPPLAVPRQGAPEPHAARGASPAGGRGGDRPDRVPVGWRFVIEYAAAYTGVIIMLIAPLVVTLALKLDALVGDQAPTSLAVVAGLGSLVAMVGNPVFGRLSDRTTSPLGMRRPWVLVGLAGGTVGTLIVALAPTVAIVVLGWCLAQLFLNAVLAALLAVLPDQVPSRQRGFVSGVLGVCLPVASVLGTLLVKLFSPHTQAMFLAPCLVGGVAILWFMWRLDDRRLDPANRTPWSWRELATTFWVRPNTGGDFLWAFSSRFLFVFAYACLTSYEAFYLLNHLGSSKHDVPGQVFVATVMQSALVIAASLVGGPLSDRTRRRKVFVMTAAAVFSVAMLVLALTSALAGFYLALAISGVGLGLYVAVDLALVVDVLPDAATAAKDLGVFNIAGALPYSLAPALAPAILAIGSYPALYAVASLCAMLAAAGILPVRGVR